MEGFLRLALLFIAATIVFLIVKESRNRHRVRPLNHEESQSYLHADKILGLDTLEPTIRLEDIRREPMEEVVVITPPPAPAPRKKVADDFLILTVAAKPDSKFGSYDLLQSITATGMQFGDMNIFHYAVPSEQGSQTLFSLASATEPGDFNLDRINDISCAGLTLFTNLAAVPDPELAFDLMLKTAEQLADDLDGELRAGTRNAWNADTLKHYKQKVSQHQTMTQV
jgi:cell division protein ZipA